MLGESVHVQFMEEGDLSLHDALLSDETQATPKYSRTFYFRYCLLVATVLLVAGLIPFGLLSVLEEFQTSPPSLSAGPADDHHHHDLLPPPTTTFASPPSPSAVQVRPDLPERALTEYVNTLIGTSGYGHGNPLTYPSNLVSLRRCDHTLWNGKASSRYL